MRRKGTPVSRTPEGFPAPGPVPGEKLLHSRREPPASADRTEECPLPGEGQRPTEAGALTPRTGGGASSWRGSCRTGDRPRTSLLVLEAVPPPLRLEAGEGPPAPPISEAPWAKNPVRAASLHSPAWPGQKRYARSPSSAARGAPHQEDGPMARPAPGRTRRSAGVGGGEDLGWDWPLPGSRCRTT